MHRGWGETDHESLHTWEDILKAEVYFIYGWDDEIDDEFVVEGDESRRPGFTDCTIIFNGKRDCTISTSLPTFPFFLPSHSRSLRQRQRESSSRPWLPSIYMTRRALVCMGTLHENVTYSAWYSSDKLDNQDYTVITKSLLRLKNRILFLYYSFSQFVRQNHN